jgi:DNA-binding response OmpR family regulator
MAKILVVEDDPAISTLLDRALSADGYTVHLAGDGARALEQCAKVTPDVVLLDVNLPKMDGFQVAKEMKARPEMKNVPIVFLTAQDRPRDVIAGIQAGARHYVTKPFKLDELLAKIKKLT